MAKTTFPKDFLLNELGLPENALEDKVTDNTRWSIIHEIIFGYQGKYYKTFYSVGATEYQAEGPWEYEDEVECYEVKRVKKLIEVWEKVE